MQQPEECDPISTSYQQREYRFLRNHLIQEESKKLCVTQARSKLSDQIFVNKESKTPQLLKFHPYRPHLAVMHKNSWRYVCVCVYDACVCVCVHTQECVSWVGVDMIMG